MTAPARNDRRLARASARERPRPSRAARAVSDAAQRAFTLTPLSTNSRNFGGDGTRGAHPNSYDWHADNVANRKTFDWEDRFHLTQLEGTGRRPATADVNKDGEPDCTGTILIYSVNDSPVPTCNPYPVAAAQASCDSMYKLAGMACRRLCEESKVCPSPDLYVPALWEEWACSSTANPPVVTSMQCSGVVECTCKPET